LVPVNRSLRRRLRLPLLLGAVVVVAGVLWIVITGLLVRSDTNYLRSHLTTLKTELAAGDLPAANRLIHQMQAKAASAHARTSGPAWWLGAQLGYVGRPLAAQRSQAALVDDLAATTLPAVLRAGDALDPQQLRDGPDSIDLARVQAAQPTLDRALSATDAVSRRASALPGPTWLSSVNHDRDTLVSDITSLHRNLTDLATATRLLPAALGEHGTKRYFLAFETDAEARGLGGLPGSYAILQARHGRLSFLRFGSDDDLDQAHSHLDLGKAFANRYDADYDPQDVFFNSDSSPNFPDAARIWMAMWEDTFHQRLDGAIATDPTALSYLLGATGPVTLSDGSAVGSGNAVEFFENSIYAVFAGDTIERKAYLVQASRAVAAKVLAVPSSALVATATAMRHAVDERRLLVYSRDPAVEDPISAAPIGGVLPRTDRPFLDVVVNNSSGTKLDYYLQRDVSYSRASCASRDVTVTVSLHNNAPDHGLAPTVLGRGPGVRPEPEVGEEGLVLSVYGTHGSDARRVSVDGKRGFFQVDSEQGHPVTSTHLAIKSGQTLTVTFDIAEPAAVGPLLVRTQPAVRTQQTTIHAPRCPYVQGSPAG
jgi:hypothetical protein